MSGNLAGISLAPRQRSTGRRGFFKDRALELHDDGYAVVPIPIGSKGPVKEGWTQFGNAQTRPQVEALIREAGDGDGIGIVAKYTPMVDLDIRDHELVRKLSDLANDELGWTPDRIGQAPKIGKPYRCSKPFPKIVGREFRLPSDKPTDKPHRIEVLCDGQQWVAHHWHPETDLPYHWEDDLPPRDELPDIDEEMAWAFVTKAEEIIAENDGKFVDQVGRANGRAAANCNTGEHVNGGTYQLGDVEAIASALDGHPQRAMPPCSWDTWNRIAMAIKAAIGEHGWPLFQAWSGRNPKFNAANHRQAVERHQSRGRPHMRGANGLRPRVGSRMGAAGRRLPEPGQARRCRARSRDRTADHRGAPAPQGTGPGGRPGGAWRAVCRGPGLR